MNNLPVRNVRTDFATYPLSFGQEMLWLSHKLSNEVDPYNTVHSFLVKGTLDVTCLQIAFQALIERHSALRTIFLESETCPVQKVLPEAPFELAQISASGEIGSELQGLVEAESICRFDLGRAPLLRVTLVSSVGQQSALVIAMHHLICDAWSNDLLLRDLAVAYSSALAGRDDFKAGAESTFGQYAKLQRDLSAAGVFDTDVAYWEESIGSDISRFDILPEGTSDGSDVEIARRQLFHLPSDLATKVLRRSQDMALSPFVLYFAAWQLVLWTYSGRRRLIVGVPYAGRGESSHMDVVGYFVNTLPFTIEVRPEQAIGDFVRDVGRNVIAAIDHAGCPMELVADRLRKRGSLGAGPLFQSLFNFRPQSRSQEIALGEATLVPWIAERSPLKFDLGIDLAVSAASVEVAVEYAEHPGSAAVVPRLIDLFATVLEAISSDDDRCVWNACELPEADAQYLGALSHQGQAHTGGAQGLIHGHIESQAQLAPDAQALVYGEAALSYAELNARANRLAHHLIGLGVGPETKVGVALERSVELVVALLAVLKAGGAYVPLDPSYPAERLAYMMVDSGLELVLTHSVSRQALPLPEGVTALEVDRLDVSARPASNPEVTVHPENLAYVIYTSGSTGRPKGAGNRHGALANRLDWMQQAYGLDSSDTVLQKTPFSFDVSVWEFFWPLMAGARLAVAPPGAHRDPAELVALIERHQVTTLHFVPSMLQAFVEHDGAAQCIGIHRIVCSGEALPAALQDRTLALLPQARLYNLYGPTEAAIDVTHWTCSAGDAVVPIGRPIDNVQTYVLDASMNLAPPGVPGELYLGGAGLGRGYEGKPGLTAERFVPDPYGEDGGRLYRTGDLARWNDAGALEYLGRIDHQVKIRGFRIELGELEAQLQAQPGVREAIVTAQEGPGGARLVGYVTAQAGQVLDTTTLRAHVSAALPDYMVPSGIVVLDALPLSPNGKVDRKALPAPEFASQGYEPPQGDVEKALATIWQEVLGVERVGRHDNFFELGGDSILSLKVVSGAQQAGIPMAVRQLFEHQTLQGLATATATSTLEQQPIRKIPPSERQAVPLSYAQQRQWFLWNLQPQGSAYHIAGGLRFQGGLDVAAVRASFDVLVQRHESLRTTFEQRDEGMAVQVIHDSLPYDYAFTDLTGDTDPQARLKHVAEKFGRRPFDLRAGPLLRIEVIRLAEVEHVLLVSMHHIVSDGWSIGVLLKEFVQAYQANLNGLEVSLPAMPIQYADYAVWQRGWLEAGEQERQLAYWQDYLGQEHPVLELPVDHPRLTLGQYGEARVPIELPDDLVSRIRKRAHSQGATPFIVLLSALQILLHRYSGQADIRIGIPNANRGRGETQGTIGFFVNTQVIRTQIHGRMSLSAVLELVKRGVMGAQAHQDLPFDVLVEALKPERSLSHTPLFQVMHNHQRLGSDVLQRLPGIQVESYELHERTAQFELALNTFESQDGGILANFTYAGELFEPATICQLATHYAALLHSLVSDEGICERVGEVALLDAAQREKILGSGRGDVSTRAPSPVHHQVESQVSLTPEAVALVYGDEGLSYAELNERANRLAHHLIGLGVSPETKVGVALERSMELVVALLAVLKAGGAYVPLDPSYPAERLAYMMSDSGLALVLTQSTVRDALPLPEDVAALELDRLDVNGLPHRNPAVKVHPENLAYVIYTSGSTGQPKGVMVRHAALSNFLNSMSDRPGLDAEDVLLGLTSLSFDIAALELFLPLTRGARLVVAPSSAARDAAELRALVECHCVTVMQSTPSGWQVLLAAGEDHLRIRGLCGGEALSADLARRLRDVGVDLWNMYGPTETTVWSTVDHVDDGPIVLGRPVSATQVYVLDHEMNLAPASVAGELYIGGDGVARGYLNRTALTAQRFVPDPFGEAGRRLYRTGDLMRWRTNGLLEYLGRLDHQVKIRGFRIELGEVETQLQAQGGVREAIVTVHEGPSGKRLVGYVTAAASLELDPQQLRAKLGEVVPEYMVPSAIVVLAALPLTPNGKVDRKSLPAPEFALQGYEAPQGEAEEALARIWQEVLSVARVGRHDNFFDLGGDSLGAIRVQWRVSRDLGMECDLATLISAKTLKELKTSLLGEKKISGTTRSQATDKLKEILANVS
ncbi:non-ribosomal peptide synthetase [Pollutimonas bauzanensis]|uniref:Amino acid adenylation domain-containing protein n=1 Tax=Pollutimonas bauzanensis TaxID=658167 RepID=A0A1M5W225_9BURK|nr:non-ribosomal peptide synthetase [Pollutimonas bauzanensis]SHH81507.1 amino acid adenylation domain-containing protein [Pollutimonas bauzanensis]